MTKKPTKAQLDAAVKSMVAQCVVGNAMIDEGNNRTADHIDAAQDATALWAAAIATNKSTCEALREVASQWLGTRATFLAFTSLQGVNKATASTQYQLGRKAAK